MSEEKATAEETKPMITELTPEQEEKLAVYRDKHLAMFFNHTEIDLKPATEFINWVYEFAKLDKPKDIYIVKSPMAAQKLANELCETEDVYYEFGSYVNAWDLGWLSYYNYVNEVLDIDLGEDFQKYYAITKLHIYDSIQFDLACILVELPKEIHRRVDRMHNEEGPAVTFADGYSQYYWEGVAVPEKLIMDSENITKEDILKQDNAEVRRAFREKLGGVRYYDILSDGEGVNLIDEDEDAQGFMMRLYETKLEDAVIGRNVQFIEVTCPSTKRVYNIYPPNQSSTNVWDAKASTFDNEKLKYRHGDVGLKKVDEDFDRPIIET